MKTLYLAIAAQPEGDPVYGPLYDTWEEAEQGARDMCRELEREMGWQVRPHVIDLEYSGSA